MTTTASRANPFGADVAFDDSGAAEGWAYLDDGVTVNAPYTILHMVASYVTHSSTSSCSGTVKISATVAGYKSPVVFGKFRVMGIDSSCYPSSAPAVSANSHAVSSLQWFGALLTIDLSSLALDIVQPLVVVFAPSSSFASLA